MVFVHNLNPVFLDLGFIEIRWYGVMYVLAFLFAYWYARKRIRDKKTSLAENELDTLLLWCVVGMIVGARVFEVFVWNWNYYAANPGEIIKFWHGGLSFHGALAGIIVAGWLFARSKKKSFLELADLFVVPGALGNAFGRIGNFINGELYGRITDVPWAVVFPGVEGPRHPSQLYEAFYNVLVFAVLWFLKDKKMRFGSLFAAWLVLYAAARFVTEFFREPTVMVGPLTLGQALNIPMILAGIGLWWWIKEKYK